MRKHVLAAVALVALAGCSGGDEERPTSEASPAAKAANLSPYVGAVVFDRDSERAGIKPDCEHAWALKGVGDGSQVRIVGSDGTLMGIGTLGPLRGDIDISGVTRYACYLGAEIPAVEPGGRFYVAELGEWSSEAIPEEELENRRFAIHVD